jgi:radical SAM superfamily enzyme YgiQ (UPF0313 family)
MSKRRLLLINPIQLLGGRRQQGWNGNRFVPPLSLAYVAALTPDDWDVRIVDENAGQDALRALDPRPDLVGITAYTATIPRAYTLADRCRQEGIPVALGGPHVSALPEEASRYADAVFVGQAEGAWPRLIEDLVSGRLQDRYEGGAPRLEDLPLPRRDLYPRRYFFDAVLTSKGCPYRCEFCMVWKAYGRRYQLRPVDEVLEELAQVKSPYLFFVDDNLTADQARAIRLCQGMVARGLRKRFAIQASLEMAQNNDLLVWLARAGCFLVSVGIESTDERTLRHLRKASNLKVGVEHFGEAIARIHAHGMAVSASIIFGHDQDTEETFREAQAFAVESEIDSLVYTILTPLPGTDLHERLEAEGRLLDLPLPEAYAYFDAHHVAFEPLHVSAEDLIRANREAVRRATSLPALVHGLWRTWRRTGNPLAALASFQNSRWARLNARGSEGRVPVARCLSTRPQERHAPLQDMG